jgi:hypothetical protein
LLVEEQAWQVSERESPQQDQGEETVLRSALAQVKA